MTSQIKIVVFDSEYDGLVEYNSPDVTGFDLDGDDLVVRFDPERCDRTELTYPETAVEELSVSENTGEEAES